MNNIELQSSNVSKNELIEYVLDNMTLNKDCNDEKCCGC